MFPWSPEFKWDAYHVAFFGGPYSVLATVAGTLAFMIPPSGQFILYGAVAQVSIAAMFAAGRLAVALSGHIGWLAAAIVDCAFLFAFCFFIGREIVAGKNDRLLVHLQETYPTAVAIRVFGGVRH